MQRENTVWNKKEHNIGYLWGNFKRCYMYITGIPGKESEKRAKEILKQTMTNNFSKLLQTPKHRSTSQCGAQKAG